MVRLEDIALLLGLETLDEQQEEKLKLIQEITEKRILARLPSIVDQVPEELEYITTELMIARYNRLGNENMSSYSQEGETIQFGEDDLAPYLEDIEAWCRRPENNGESVVRFL